MTTRAEIVAFANGWVGTPYKHAGRDEHGIDCAGVIIKVGHQAGIGDYDTINYPKRPVASDFLREMKTYLRLLPKAEAGNGSILMMREPSHPCHTGIMEIDARGQRWVIHSYAPARKVIREPMTPQRWGQVIMAFDYIGLED